MERLREWWAVRRYILRDNLRRRWPEKMAMWVAWRIPHGVMRWCIVRGAANVWQAGGVEPEKITYPIIARTWDERRGADRSFARNRTLVS